MKFIRMLLLKKLLDHFFFFKKRPGYFFELKSLNKDFNLDMNIFLLPHDFQPYNILFIPRGNNEWNFKKAFEFVKSEIVSKIE